jgi:hypothetical protein
MCLKNKGGHGRRSAAPILGGVEVTSPSRWHADPAADYVAATMVE